MSNKINTVDMKNTVQVITNRVLRVKGRIYNNYKFESLEIARAFILKWNLEDRIIDIITK